MRFPFALAALMTAGLLAAGLGLSPAHAAPLPCSLAVKLNIGTYLELSLDQWNEAAQDQASADYAGCRAAALSASLSKSPQLRARIAALRGLYRQLRGLEGNLAAQMAGGGTMHSHAVPRSYPELEATLSGLAALASSPLGAQTGAHFGRSLQTSRQAVDTRIKALKAWTPKDAPGSSFYDPTTFQADVTHYAQIAGQIRHLLGNRPDAATAAGYLPFQTALFVDEYLGEF